MPSKKLFKDNGLSNVKFFKSNRKDKKYRVEFVFKDKVHKVNFGQLGFQHFKDRTPLKLYKSLDHNDKDRRERYRKRHSGIRNKQNQLVFKLVTSPSFWSWNMLW